MIAAPVSSTHREANPVSSGDVATLNIEVGKVKALAKLTAAESAHFADMGEEDLRQDYAGYNHQDLLVAVLHECLVERLERIEEALVDFERRTPFILRPAPTSWPCRRGRGREGRGASNG